MNIQPKPGRIKGIVSDSSCLEDVVGADGRGNPTIFFPLPFTFLDQSRISLYIVGGQGCVGWSSWQRRPSAHKPDNNAFRLISDSQYALNEATVTYDWRLTDEPTINARDTKMYLKIAIGSMLVCFKVITLAVRFVYVWSLFIRPHTCETKHQTESAAIF